MVGTGDRPFHPFGAAGAQASHPVRVAAAAAALRLGGPQRCREPPEPDLGLAADGRMSGSAATPPATSTGWRRGSRASPPAPKSFVGGSFSETCAQWVGAARGVLRSRRADTRLRHHFCRRRVEFAAELAAFLPDHSGAGRIVAV